jgi:predicted ATPase
VAPQVLHIPATVKGVLAARMDRLAPAHKELLQTLAIIGKEFPWSLVRQVTGQPEDQLRHLLAGLQASEFIYERPAFPEVEYAFKHALTQEVAGQALLADQRCALHERTAHAIEALFRRQLKDHCGELAHHYGLSGNIPKAVEYLQCTACQAIGRSAHLEAIPHLSAALDLLKRLPDTPERARQELELQIALGPALIATKGYASPEVEETFTRALALCEQGGETRQLFQAKLGLRTFFSLRAEHRTAYDLGERLLALAQSAGDEELIGQAHIVLGTSSFYLGEAATARIHLEQGLVDVDLERDRANTFLLGQDPIVHGFIAFGRTLWYLGYPDQAGKRIQEALALARKLAHPYSLAQGLTLAAELYQCRREAQRTLEYADAAVTLSTEQGFPFWLAWATILRGWALAEQGSADDGMTQLRKGLAAYHATGAELARPYQLALLAETCGKAGHAEVGLETLAEALDLVACKGERYYVPELYRLKGELLLRRSAALPDCEAEAAKDCFHQAIAMARQQGARSLEQRAATSLARLWNRQSRTAAARQVLAVIHGTFTEGFDTADWQEAQMLLDALAQSDDICPGGVGRA